MASDIEKQSESSVCCNINCDESKSDDTGWISTTKNAEQSTTIGINIAIQDFLNLKATLNTIDSLSVLCKAMKTALHNDAMYVTDETCKLLSIRLYDLGATPNLQQSEDCGYSKADFPNCAKISVLCMQVYEWLLVSLSQSDHDRAVVEQVIVESLLICAEHLKTSSWSSSSSVRTASHLISHITNFASARSTEELCSDRLDAILDKLKSRLVSWKLNPAAAAAFCWVVTRASYLDDDLLAAVLPVSLRFVDDFEPRHQFAGVECLRHVVSVTAPAVLQRRGAADVIYAALHRLLTTREAELLTHVGQCLAECLPRLDSSMAETRAVDILASVRSSMDGENQLALRLAYAQSLPSIINLAGIYSLPLLPALLRVFADYLEVVGSPDERTRCAVLRALHALIAQTWPRLSQRWCACVVTAVMRCVYDVATALDLAEDMRDEVVDVATHCLVTLKRICPQYVEQLVNKLDQIRVNNVWYNCVHSILQAE